MPELPEVQTIVDQLQERLPGNRFAPGAEFLWPGTAGYPGAGELAARLAGRRVVHVGRRAKYILIELDDGMLTRCAPSHDRQSPLRSAGRPVSPLPSRAPAPGKRDRNSAFADMRKFGRFYVGTPAELDAVIPSDGSDRSPSTRRSRPPSLGERLAGRRGPIKSALLDQTGARRTREHLCRRGPVPSRHSSLARGRLAGGARARSLHGGIVAALSEALANRGTSFRNYLSASGEPGDNEPNLMVFRRHGRPCPRCGTLLERIAVAARGTHYCPGCQR